MSIRRLVALLLLLVAPAGATTAAADPIIYRFGVDPAHADQYGKLMQKDLKDIRCGGLDGFGCGPAAAINSFVYLQNAHAAIYGKKLVPELDRTKPANDLNKDGKVDGYDDMMAAAGVLAESYMDTCCDETTLRSKFYSGKREYIEDRVPGVTTYGAMDDPRNDTRDPKGNFPAGTPDLERKAPTVKFLTDALERKQDIEMLVWGTDAAGKLFGHYTTVTGLEFTDTDKNGMFDRGEPSKIHLMDSEAGGITRDLLLHADGYLYWVSPSTGRNVEVGFAVEESPKERSDDMPEPTSFALLSTAALVAAWRARCRRR